MRLGTSGDRMRYWLMKSEPDEFSIDDLVRAPRQGTAWFGVRNYQARNFMRDEMKVGDRAFFYHSSCPEPGIAGIVEVCAPAHPDATQFDPRKPVLRPEVDARGPALGRRRRAARREDAPRAARRVARPSRARRHGDPAPRQPAVDHAGDRGRVEGRRAARSREFLTWTPCSSPSSSRSAPSSASSPGSSASAAA